MPRESVFCLVPTRDLANHIVGRVKVSGFSINDVSALFPDQDTGRDLSLVKSTRAHRREQPPASQRTAWWTARQSGFNSIGAVAIPGVGPFVAAGPIIFALSGAVVGGADGGGLAQALIGMGVSESEACHYEDKICAGSILISVHAENPADIILVTAVLREAGARNICTTDGVHRVEGTKAHCPPGPSESSPCLFDRA